MCSCQYLVLWRLDYLISRTFFAPVLRELSSSRPYPGTEAAKRKPVGSCFRGFLGVSGMALFWPPEPSGNQVKLNKHAGRGASGIPQKQTNVQMGRGAGSPPGAAFHAAGSLPLRYQHEPLQPLRAPKTDTEARWPSSTTSTRRTRASNEATLPALREVARQAKSPRSRPAPDQSSTRSEATRSPAHDVAKRRRAPALPQRPEQGQRKPRSFRCSAKKGCGSEALLPPCFSSTRSKAANSPAREATNESDSRCSKPTTAKRRRTGGPSQIKISPESPLSGQQGQFALAVLGFVHRTSTARQTPTAHLRTSRNCAMINPCTRNERTRSLRVANFDIASCKLRVHSSTRLALSCHGEFRLATRATRTAPKAALPHGRSKWGGSHREPTYIGPLHVQGSHKPSQMGRLPGSCLCMRARLPVKAACMQRKPRTRALAHRALAHLKTQTTTYPESPPRRAARAVVPVVWVSRAVHEPTQRGEEQRTNGGVAVWAVQTGSS